MIGTLMLEKRKSVVKCITSALNNITKQYHGRASGCKN